VLNRAEAPPGALAGLLARRPAHRVNWGLDRIRFILEALGSPELKLQAIHVAGTNGKGSVVITADAVLRAAGYRTGRYTSPHLVAFSERIVIDDEPASQDLLESCAQDVLPLADEVDATFFEATTALAFVAFARAGVTSAVIEVGLGGRLDATNVLTGGVSVISSIAHDHAEYLGTDLGSIAREKAGIFRRGGIAIIGPVGGEAGTVLRQLADESGAIVQVFGSDFETQDVTADERGMNFIYHSRHRAHPLQLRTPLRGMHQVTNAALGVAAVDAFTRGAVSDAEIASGVESVHWPGRFQVEEEADGTWVYDIAHNPAAAEALAEIVCSSRLPKPIVLLAAVMGDKSWSEALTPLLAVTEAAVFTVAPSCPEQRRWDPFTAQQMLGAGSAIDVIPEFDRALAAARARAGAGTVLVSGSCHTVGDALRRNGRA
jgi:dihydrofolate synthase/folylpolyglutamate synthase